MAYFPLFIDITDRECLIVGGGSVAYRKAMLLLDYAAKIKVVTKTICPEMETLASDNKLEIELRSFQDSDLDNKTLVIVATNDRDLNHEISTKCKARNIMVNVVDVKEECSFILPSIVRQQDVVAAFSSSGKSPLLTQYLKKQEQEILTPYIGEINELLGSIRDRVKKELPSEKQRKIAYNNVLEYALNTGELPDDNKIEELIHDI